VPVNGYEGFSTDEEQRTRSRRDPYKAAQVPHPHTSRVLVALVSVNSQLIETTPQRVWDVLADGWLFPLWVVGASRVRDVDDFWPSAGAKIHHSVGVWPWLINDHTEVLEVDPESRLKLLARGWPVGEAEVAIDVEPSGHGTQVIMTEKVVSGPGRFIPSPLMEPSLSWRNVETLRRLAYVAEGRT
jgi:uncharacterized protein YndB with AHSA1/START domain